MKIHSKYFPAIILLFAFSFGCEKSNPVSNDILTQGIIPIAKGNSWYYSGIWYDTLGSVIQRSYAKTDVKGDTIIFGKKLAFYSGRRVANSDSGLIAYAGYSLFAEAPTDTIVNYMLLYKYPARTGDIYDYGMRIGTTDTIVSVPAGTFHCIKYMYYENGILGYSEYVSPGIGVIKLVTNFGVFNKKYSMQVSSVKELESYKLN